MTLGDFLEWAAKNGVTSDDRRYLGARPAPAPGDADSGAAGNADEGGPADRRAFAALRVLFDEPTRDVLVVIAPQETPSESLAAAGALRLGELLRTLSAAPEPWREAPLECVWADQLDEPPLGWFARLAATLRRAFALGAPPSPLRVDLPVRGVLQRSDEAGDLQAGCVLLLW